MWHYVEGIHNWDPIWPDHAIRIIPGPSSLWLDATGKRLPAPYFPGFDTLGTLKAILATGHDYSWFILTQSIIEKEFALSGSEQNPDVTGKDLQAAAAQRLTSRARPGPVEAFKQHGVGLRRARQPARPRRRHERDRARARSSTSSDVEREVVARDREVDNKYSKDLQLMAITQRAPLPRRQADPGRQAAPAARPRRTAR